MTNTEVNEREGRAEDREGHEDAADEVVGGDDDRRRDDDPPIAVEGEERQRAEDVEVRLDAAGGQVDQ